MADQKLLIDFKELDKLEVTCKDCGTGLVISAMKQAPGLRSDCPGCGKSIHLAATAVTAFKDFFKSATDSGLGIVFRIAVK